MPTETDVTFADLIPVSHWVTRGSLLEAEGKILIVHKVNRKNYLCYDEAGEAWNLRRADQEPLPSSTNFDSTAYIAALKAIEARERAALDAALACTLTFGSTVEFTEPAEAAKWPGVYVVLNVPSAANRVKVAKLGGDGGRYVNSHTTRLRTVRV